MVIKKLTDAYLIRLDRGEDLISSILKFAKQQEIRGGFFHGLGGAESATLGIYRLDYDREYHYRDFAGPLEILSINGNIALDEAEDLMIHCHATISGVDFNASGGHVKKMKIAGTCEIFVDLRTEQLNRVHDYQIGLKLIDFNDK